MSDKPKTVHFVHEGRRGVRTVWIGRRAGPAWTTFGGEIDQATLVCHGCRHLLFNDYHYPYCSAQWNKNQQVNAENRHYAYPWKGAGTHIYRPTPGRDCPYPTPWTDVTWQPQ